MPVDTPGKVTFYKRPLPVPPAVEFSSVEGRKLFQDALASGTCEGFFKLIEQFMTQDESTFCGLASIAMVLNALAIDPRRPWRGAWRYFHDTMLDCCLPLDVIKQQGTTLEQAACLARCNGAQVTSHHYGAFTIDEFRQQVEEVCRTGNTHIVVSYSRRTFLQTGDGHFSPIGAYHKDKDLVLILDVARFKYPPHWVPLAMLVEAMSALDPATLRPRGYLLLAPRAPIPVTFTLDISNPTATAWCSALRFLDTHVPQLLSAIQWGRASGTPVDVKAILQQADQSRTTCLKCSTPACQTANQTAVEALTAVLDKVEIAARAGPPGTEKCAPLAGIAGDGVAAMPPSINEASTPELPADAGPAQVLHTLMRMLPLEGADMLLAARNKALVQDVQDPSACQVCNPLLHHAEREQHQQQQQEAQEEQQQQQMQHQQHQQQQQQQQQQQHDQKKKQNLPGLHEQDPSKPMSIPPKAGGCRGSGGYCTESGCGAGGSLSGSPTFMGLYKEHSCGGGACGAGCGTARAAPDSSPPAAAAAAVTPVEQAGSGTGSTSINSNGLHLEQRATSVACSSGAASATDACALSEQDPVLQELRTTELFAVTHTFLTTSPAEGLPAPLHAYFQQKQQRKQQQQKQGSPFGQGQHEAQQQEQGPDLQQQQQQQQQKGLLQQQQEQKELLQQQQQQQQSIQDGDSEGLNARCPARQVCTLHMVSKVAMLLLLSGLEHTAWSNLWRIGTPERRQWWLWVGKPLETLPFLSAEVKYLRLQLGEVQKLVQIQGEHRDLQDGAA